MGNLRVGASSARWDGCSSILRTIGRMSKVFYGGIGSKGHDVKNGFVGEGLKYRVQDIIVLGSSQSRSHIDEMQATGELILPCCKGGTRNWTKKGDWSP